MTTKPKAIHLAETLEDLLHDWTCANEAAAELRNQHEEINQLKLAEVGAQEAFGVVVISKQHLESECRIKQSTIFSQQAVIVSMRQQRDELLAAMKETREALRFANDSPGGGISDTIWMFHRPETLFDFMDAAIEKAMKAAV